MSPPLLALSSVLVGLTLAAAPASGQAADRVVNAPAEAEEAGAIAIPGGSYIPLYAAGSDTGGIAVDPFRLGPRPVTVASAWPSSRSSPGGAAATCRRP